MHDHNSNQTSGMQVWEGQDFLPFISKVQTTTKKQIDSRSFAQPVGTGVIHYTAQRYRHDQKPGCVSVFYQAVKMGIQLKL